MILLLALCAGPPAEAHLTAAHRERLREQAAWAKQAGEAKGDPRPLLRRVLEADREVFGEVRWSREATESRLIDEEAKRDRLGEALALCRDRLARCRRLHGTAHWATHDTAETLATLEAVEAMDAGQRARWRKLDAWIDESQTPAFFKRMQEGVRRGREAVAEAERLFGKEHALTLSALRLLGQEQYFDMRSEDLLATNRRGAALCRRLKGGSHPRTGGWLSDLAAALRERGDADAALPPARQAVEVYRRAMGESHKYTAYARETLGTIHRARGEFAEARRQFLLCLRTREAVFKPEDPAIGDILYNLARLQQEGADHVAALAILRRCDRVYQAAYGEDYAGKPSILDLIGRSLSRQGKHQEARQAYFEAARICMRRGETRTPRYAEIVGCLGTELVLAGEVALAVRSHLLALEIARKTRHPDLDRFLINAALARREEGRHDEAVRLAEEGLRSLRKRVPAYHPVLAWGWDVLASVRQARGDLREARADGERGLEAARGFLRQAEAAQSEREQLAAEADLRDPLGLLLSLPGSSAEADHAHVFAWKGAVQAAQQARRQARRSTSDAGMVAAELEAVSRELGRLSVAGRSREKMEPLARRKDELEARLAEDSPAYRAARKALDAGTADLKRSLPADSALIDFFVYRWSDYGQPMSRRFRLRLAAFVVRPRKPTVRVELGPEAAVARAVAAWRADPGSPRAGAVLRRMVWLPLERHLEGCRVVLLSPDGSVSGLPFGALPGGKRGAYLLEERLFPVVPVPRLLASGAKPAPARASMLAVGDVDHGGPGKWAALPGSRLEVEELARRFEGAKVIRGREATAEAVARALPGRSHLHFATHGYFVPQGDPSSWHPGLATGLVLAGANKGGGVLTAQELAGLDLSSARLAVLSACETGLGDIAAGEGVLGLQRALHVAGARTAVTSLWSVSDAATSLLMRRFYDALESRKNPAEALREAQVFVMRNPDKVEERAALLSRGLKRGESLRGAGRKAEKLPGGARRSPVEWWGAFVLSGDWR
ncbi:MAG: CHAT domain-containing protein [Gemmataceae bacterium]|nr:CHAT domain-containing protein [Gemmataceae bacterium]